MPRVSGRITEALVAKKEADPSIEVIFITDEFNTGYGSHDSIHLEQLENALLIFAGLILIKNSTIQKWCCSKRKMNQL
ncbi:hypothetical protein [Alteribacter keqinensis]|uniref:hypothetical protein n=1 Tax=Alteribacter keqinensis TaxID=2483800 RepID=UPI00115D3830|nr:hypothetical protein [Alteribacter keqinensis]